MAVLILDFESTGIDTSTARVTEIGAMLTDNEFRPLGHQMSQLVYDSDYPPITPEVELVTGITQDLLNEKAVVSRRAFHQLGNLLTSDVEYVLAYNRAYDEALFRAEMTRGNYFDDPCLHRIAKLPWICGMVDVESNYKHKCWKLSHLALDYGVAVDPSILHRAINDVELTRQMLVAAKASPQDMHAYQVSPWLYVKAKVQAPWTDGGVSNAKAKLLGFTWEKAKGDDKVHTKTWVRRIKEKEWQAVQDAANKEMLEVKLI